MNFIVKPVSASIRPPLDQTMCVLCSEDPRWCA